MAKKKTTLYADEDLLRAMRVRAAREDKADYQVFEEAMRSYLGLEVLERIWSRDPLAEDEAMALADEAVHSSRDRSRKRLAK